tara:strand:- start:107 stop:382 length:276 start_codon:yes stop_codon:yes gene_type:complete
MKLTKTHLKKIIQEEIQSLNEMDLDAVRLPSNVQRFTDKLIQQIQRVRLTRIKMYSLVARIVSALDIDVQKLTQMMMLIKKDMKKSGKGSE